MKTNITLNQIKAKKPCSDGYEKLLNSLNKTKADDTIVSINHLLKSNGISDTLWVIYNCIEDEKDSKRNMCLDFVESAIQHAESVLHIFEKEKSDDNRPRLAIETAKKCVEVNRNSPAYAAGTADAAYAAAYAAYAAADTVYAAARSAAYAAYAAAYAAARAAAYAAGTAAYAVEESKQKQIILKYFQ
jgi:hypothetical protein